MCWPDRKSRVCSTCPVFRISRATSKNEVVETQPRWCTQPKHARGHKHTAPQLCKPCTTTRIHQTNLPQSCTTGTSNKTADLQQDCMLRRIWQTENHSQDSRRQTESCSNTSRSTIDRHGKTVVFNSAIVHNRDRRAGRMNDTVPAVLRVYFLGLEQWVLSRMFVWARISSVFEAGRHPVFSLLSPDWPVSEK